MPIFEYECTKCTYKLEIFDRTRGRAKPICNQCGTTMDQLIGTPAFKGNDFVNQGLSIAKKSKDRTEEDK